MHAATTISKLFTLMVLIQLRIPNSIHTAANSQSIQLLLSFFFISCFFNIFFFFPFLSFTRTGTRFFVFFHFTPFQNTPIYTTTITVRIGKGRVYTLSSTHCAHCVCVWALLVYTNHVAHTSDIPNKWAVTAIVFVFR